MWYGSLRSTLTQTGSGQNRIKGPTKIKKVAQLTKTCELHPHYFLSISRLLPLHLKERCIKALLKEDLDLSGRPHYASPEDDEDDQGLYGEESEDLS